MIAPAAPSVHLRRAGRGPVMQSVPLSPSAFAVSAVGHLALFAALLAATALWQHQEAKVYVVNLVPSVAAVGNSQGQAASTPSREATAPRAAAPTPAAVRPSAAEPAVAVPPPPGPVAPRPASRAKDAAALPDRPAVRGIPAPPLRSSVATAAPALPPPRMARRPDGDEPAPRPARSAEPTPRVAQVAPSDTAARRTLLRDLPPAAPSRPAQMPVALPPDTSRRLMPGASTPAPSASPPGTTSRAVALPRAGQKDLPSLASPMPSLAPLPPVAQAAPTTRVAPPAPAPAPAPVAALGQPTGSPQGRGAITMNVSDFPFAWYLQTVQRKINEKWAPPARGSENRAVIVFEIGRNGDVRRPAVENSSGDAGYDQAALRAVAEANPFPPLPVDYRPQVLKIYLGFDFAANRG